MVKRIDLFMPPRSQYGVLHHFTNKFGEALARSGVKCRTLEAERYNPKPFLEEIFRDPPDCTLSFNGLLPDHEGRFFCDLIQIPHVACVVDSPNLFFPLANSTYTIITCVDQYSCEFFQGLKAPHVLFMPHGVEKELTAPIDQQRPYDVVMLSSLIDYDMLRQLWQQKFPPELCTIMDVAVDRALSDQETSYVQAFVQAMDEHAKKSGVLDLNKVNIVEVLDQIEAYMRGKDRIELLKAVQGVKIDVFGSAGFSDNWKKYLGKNAHNIIVHDPVSFEQALEIMKQSKILLNSCPWIKNGAHERIFSGLACGALVVTNENPYMRKYFKDGENIVYYHHKKWQDVNQKVHDYLTNEEERKLLVEKGRAVTMQHHTWDHRAKSLVKALDPILAGIKSPLI